MPVEERHEGRKEGETFIEKEYLITGSTTSYSARAALLAALPSTLNTDYELVGRAVTVEETAENIYEGRARWEILGDQDINENRFTFDILAGQFHIDASISTVSSKDGSGSPAAKDYGQLINVQLDESVKGVDLPQPGQFEFSETHYLDIATVTDTYLNNLVGLQYKTNDATFRRYSAGEVLFLGASGSREGLDLWEISYKFGVSLDKTGISYAGFTGINKGGWEYLWASYMHEEDGSGNIRPVPEAVFVEQVFYSGSFSVLGI